MSDPRTDRLDPSTDVGREPAPDMLAELGSFAYGLFALSEQGPLTQVRTLADSRGAQLPLQGGGSSEPEVPATALLGHLSGLDL